MNASGLGRSKFTSQALDTTAAGGVLNRYIQAPVDSE
jgi:hypothetical protein